MKSGATRILLPAIVFLLVLTAPALVEARPKHYFDCTDCHTAGLTLWSMDNSNVCLKCHNDPPSTWTLRDGDRTPASSFTTDDASDAMGSHPGAPANQTSHNWATTDDTIAEAGATRPLSRYLYGRYNISAGKITCSRCHNPHGADTSPELLKFDNSADQYCLDCHRPWDVANVDAVETHPIVADYNAVVTANPDDFNASPVNTGSGDVRLVSGGVSCSSCHGMHYTDSDSATADGMANYNSLSVGDGKMLRSDGPLRTGGTRNGATGTAQLRSNLCQACHAYEIHGKGASGDHQIGCLDCHGGHAYNGGSPNAFVLNSQSPDAVPTRPDGVNGASAVITFPPYGSGGSTRTKWADEAATATGFCEQCHGDVNAMTGKATEHGTGDGNECTACHRHNDPADVHAFAVDASAATCGQCHGFPPYINDEGNRDNGGSDGGYAYNDVDAFGPIGYNSAAYFKDETQTGHKTHAGADLPTNPGDWYFVGASGIDNCKPCHGPDASTTAGGHREDPATYPDTFRDVPFNDVASANGNLTPTYVGDACDQIYCHSNGFPRTGDGPTRSYASGAVATPVWVGDGTTDGFGAITGKGTRCQFCHGNDATSMNSANSANSAAHQAHLGQETTGMSFGCDVCHLKTASDNNTLSVLYNATDGRLGGTHVNELVDVDYRTSGSALYNALAVNAVGPNYDTAAGTCAVYCHDPADTGNSADWDSGDEVAGTLNCDDCHGGLTSDTSADGGAGPIATGSHARHVTAANGPTLACAECHGTDSDAGTHAGHIDGIVDVIPPVDGVTFSSICEECHGYDAEAGEVLPVWGNASTTDCATCHAGIECGAVFEAMSPNWLGNARVSGHNRLAASGNFPQSGNVPADLACLDCHLTEAPEHWNGTPGDSYLLRADDGFPATYAGSEDAFCDNCHGSAPGSVNAASAATQNINTHQAKQCKACHNIHGTANIQMVHQTQADQVAADGSATGKYGADVFFANSTNYNAGNLDSYDEDDGAAGGAGEANGDDICATCHTVAAGTNHNNFDNSTGDHYQGEDCFTCHVTHDDATDAFRIGAGTACNDCHGFPPATAAHRTGNQITDPELHSNTTTNDKDVEDRTDCAWCHTGADLYTYDVAADQTSGNPDRDNHAVSQANRQSVLNTSVGYNSTDGSCATACHDSSAGDGFWSDSDGIDCSACHYYSATPTSAGNAGDVSASHDEHFDAGKVCTDCHTVDNGGAALPGVLAHIIAPDFSGAGDDGVLIQGRAVAALDEAAVTRASMTYNSTNNTCSGGIGLACHATGTPDWDVAIPNDGTGCADCHTDTTTSTVNPTSGLHDNSAAPVTSGVSHDGAFTYNSGTLNADCATCHTTAPSSAHMDGTLDASYNTVTIDANVGFTDAATPTCTTSGFAGCHLEGTVWERKWDTSAYNNDATRCANCHGDYASGWVAGVIHAEAGNETRGTTHNNTGTESYPCSDCHAIGATTAVYDFTDSTADWSDGGEVSHHGDNILHINASQPGDETNFDDSGARAGCATANCHGNDANHDFQKSAVYSVAGTNLVTLAGDVPDVPCSGCHGGGTVGANANNYWPDSSNGNAENTAGEHAAHMEKLSLAVYGEQYNTVLLTDNGNGTADAKQQELCAYCHDTPGADGDHGLTANLPAETNAFYEIWEAPRVSLDDGLYNSVADTCSTVDCHDNKLTTDNVYGWYDGGSTACVMCHLDVTTEDTHTDHTGASAAFGRSIGCDDCHQTAAENVAWGAPGTPPANNHINGAFTVTGSVAFTYNSVSQSCGTNECHEDGSGGAPNVDPYGWGSTLADCTTCHTDPPATGAHTAHMNNAAYVACADCHTTASNAAHIDNAVTYNTAVVSSYNSVDGTCANTCHAGSPSDWRDSAPGVGCTDCHGGTYIGSGAYMPQYNMHVVTPTVSGEVHDDTVPGAGGDCAFCHDSMPAPGGSHVDGTWNADSGVNTDRGLFADFTDGTPGTCTTACHSAGTSWTYKWSATAANSDGTECANCHGDYASGWNAGVGHAVNPGRGNSANHNDTGTLTYECTACHVIGATTGNYPWTSGTNDWASEGTTLHGDGNLTVNDNSTSHTRNENPVGTWLSGCAGCHDGPSNDGAGADDANHDFPVNLTAPSSPRWALLPAAGDAAAAGGGCDTCHGGSGEFAPNDPSVLDGAYPNRAGKHAEHISAIAIKLGGDTQANRNDSCDYCHLNPGEGGHDDNTIPSADWDIRHILNYNTVDSDPVINRTDNQHVTCSTVDCHFNNAVTPHWYTDDVAPAAVTLTAVAGPDPRSIQVSWSAPGDDNNVANTTPYVYDMRYSVDDGGTDATNYASTTNLVGGLPAAYKQGYNSVTVVENLTPGSNYYFSLKTRDTAGNWSAASAVAGPVVPTVDTSAPAFGGADKARKGDKDQTINLDWTPGEDHTMPVTYDIWMTAEGAGSGTGGALDMDVDTPVVTGWPDHKIQLTSAHGVANDTIYNLGVRACDPLANCDTNTQTVSATPTAPPLVDKTYHTYVTNGSETLVKEGSPGTQASSALPIVFAPATNLTYDVTYFTDTFAVYLDVGNTAGTARAEIGYSTNGSDFVGSGKFVDVSFGKRSDRVYQFKLVDVAGETITAGHRFAIELTEPSATGISAFYGSATDRGDVTVAERIVNIAPTQPTDNVTAMNATDTAVVDIAWNASFDSTDGLADSIHYDLYGSDDNGLTFDYLIASDLTTLSYSWDAQAAGVPFGSTIAVRVEAGDSYDHSTPLDIADLAMPAADGVRPGQITDLEAEKRPKSGTVWLTWSAPGDDGANNGRADYYDIRYSTSSITEGNFGSATQVTGEPDPDFGGEIQNYEVTGLTPETTYYFAIKTYDENGNASPISTAKTAGSDQQVGGPRCGMCHTTAPSVDESVGNHKLHGFTLNDCDKCHDDGVTPPSTYGLDHQDGVLKMGYGPGGAHQGTISGNRIYYTDDGTPGGTVMYDDTDGFGGFGDGTYNSVGDGIDSGSCINFGALGVGGCHGSAGTDPDGAATRFPTYPTPTWDAAATLDCSACHGNPDRTVDNFYNRDFDATIDNGGVPTDQILGSPSVDNHGNYADDGSGLEEDRKYIGQHEKHLNYSFRFSKGDSCNLCHAGNYSDKTNLDGRHANGEVDIQLDLNAAGPNAAWAPGTATTAGTCSNMSPDSCHPSASTPKWDTAQSFDCRECHGMAGVTPSHVTDPAGSGFVDDGLGNCEWCHFGGHPRDDVGGTSLILANSSQVGIDYRSGGIHLRKSIGGRAAQATEAQLCWTCHDSNGISEWGTDTGANNTSTEPPNPSDYDYGSLDSSNWTTATWTSAEPNFSYKTGAIQSTHSTNETGTSALTGSDYAYIESPDTVDKIRCSNCHDVHNLNKAPGDTMTGQPYLRGTWIRNPYPEDGAPWNKTYTTVVANFTSVPRAGGNEMGGYQIDQNNGSPTAGLSLAGSAGLCTLCHGTDVDTMNKTTSGTGDGTGLWIGTNGHSNATLGGTASNAANIFGNGIGGRPIPNAAAADGNESAGDVYDMALQTLPNQLGATTEYGYGYRSDQNGTGKYAPTISSKSRAYNDFTWGVTVDQTTTDIGYHAFTCSKCHNPHASRLPKLMITNCLDTSHNTWQDSTSGQGSSQAFWNQGSNSITYDVDEDTATHNTAQNCHRYDRGDNVGGWNTVTPW